MSSPFGKKPVPDSVKAEIDARASAKGILWAAKRFPWIHLMSMSGGCEDDRYIRLSSTKSEPLYESNFVKPFPIITQLEVKAQGELGTTRKVTVNLTAFTDAQFQKLSRCYFVPGMTVRVQWGWSQSAQGGGVPPIALGRTQSDSQAICDMNSAAAANTNYCGIQGKVANFTQKLNESGYWDCTIEIISAAEPFSGTKVNEYSCDKCARKYKNESPEGGGEEKEMVARKSSLYTMFYDLFKDYDTGFSNYRSKVKKGDIAQYAYNGPARDEKGGDQSSWYESGLFKKINQPDTKEAYISWYAFEDAVNRNAAPTSGGKYLLGKLDSKDIKLKAHPNLESSDPRICIIPGTNNASKIAMKEKGTESNAISDGVILGNIMLNTVFLMNELDQVEKSDGKLMTFLNNVLAKVNDTCGGLWELAVVSNSENCADKPTEPILSVIDTKVYEPAAAYPIPSLPIGQRASVLRDLKLEMKMTDSMKTQALYSNADQQSSKTPAGGGCGSNMFGGFTTGTFKDLSAPAAKDPKPCDCEGGSKDATPTPPTFEQIFEELGDDVCSTSVSAAKSALIDAYAKSIKTDDKHCIGAPLPYDFGFTLDGIGGFAFGQIVTSDRIPEPVRSSYDFQITAVEHSVTPNDWTTTVSTVCRYKGKK